MRHNRLVTLRNLGVLLAGLSLPTAALPCSLKIDPVTAVGLPGEQGTLRDGPNNDVIIVDQGDQITLIAYWGDDANSNGRIDPPGEWTNLAGASQTVLNQFAGKKMSELTSRGGFLDPSNFLGMLFTIHGGIATFNTNDSPGALLKNPPRASLEWPWNPGSGNANDYPISLDDPATALLGLMTGGREDTFWQFDPSNPNIFGAGTYYSPDSGSTWSKWTGQSLTDTSQIRIIERQDTTHNVSGQPWIIPSNAWGSDWRVDAANTAYFPDKFALGNTPAPDSRPGNEWIRRASESSFNFTFKTVTDPRCFELQVDSYVLFVLADPMTVNWKEHQYNVTANTTATDPTVLPTDPIWTGASPGGIPSIGWTITKQSGGGISKHLDIALAIQKTGRGSSNVARVGRRRILVRDQKGGPGTGVGAVWNGYESLTNPAKVPTVNMSTPTAYTNAGNTMKVQVMTRNPYWDNQGPPYGSIPMSGRLISGINKNRQATTSAHDPANFRVELRYLVQEVEGYQGVEGPICQEHKAQGRGVAHGNPDQGYCDCYAVPIPRFTWKKTGEFTPANITVHRFNRAGGGLISSDPQGAADSDDVGTLGANAFFSILEFEVPLSRFTEMAGVNYGPRSQASPTSGPLNDYLGRSTGVNFGTSTGSGEGLYPRWPANNDDDIPLTFAVVVTNDGSGNSQEHSAGEGPFNDASDNFWTPDIVDQYAQGSLRKFSPRRSPDSDVAPADLAVSGYTLFATAPPASFADAAIGYGQYGYYKVVDDIPPELYIQVIDSKYDRHFLFGDHKWNPHAQRAQYKSAVESQSWVPGPIPNEAVPGEVKAELALDFNGNAAAAESGLLSQNALVAANTFFPVTFSYHLPGGDLRPRYWVDEDTPMVFRVIARDNINFWMPNAGISTTADTGSDPLFKRPNTWAVVDAPAGNPWTTMPFPQYIFRKPNVSSSGDTGQECSVFASVQDENSNQRSVKVRFSIYDRQMKFYQLEEKRQKVEETDTGNGAWWQD